jgi:hypothetical protein
MRRSDQAARARTCNSSRVSAALCELGAEWRQLFGRLLLGCILTLQPARLLAAPIAPELPGAAPRGAGPAAAVGFDVDAEVLRAYHAALAERHLDAFGSLSVERMRVILADAEAALALGRRDEAISILSGLVESPRFAPLRELDEGRAALFLLADALVRAGADPAARHYLVALIQSPRVDNVYSRAVSRLVDMALVSENADEMARELSALPAAAHPRSGGDVAYLRGILHERAGRLREAVAVYGEVPPSSRFWAQANYRAGLVEVEQARLPEAEQQFCKLADPKQTPRTAPLFGGNDFFQVRDLSRLALGRVAHEQYRFDDARYYYQLVPADSDRLPEALYESATSRYEAKDYASAHDLLTELRSLEQHHPYADEAWILDAYVDLAQCQFPRADAKLREFLKRYEPVLSAARQLQDDPGALRGLLGGEGRAGRDGQPGLGGSNEVKELLLSSIRVDIGFGELTRQLADLDHQISGLRSTHQEIEALRQRVKDPHFVSARLPVLDDRKSDQLGRVRDQLGAAGRLLQQGSRTPGPTQASLEALRPELEALQAEASALRQTDSSSRAEPAAAGDALSTLLAQDAGLAGELQHASDVLRVRLVERQDELGRQALSRLEQRLARLVRRARAGRIETVLGRKHALEVEVEALSQGFLPRGAVDSLDAASYLGDGEEYWPSDGEDWDDEYVGGEGLR